MISVEDGTFGDCGYARFLDQIHKQFADVSNKGGNSKAVRSMEARPRVGSAKEFGGNELHFCSGLFSLFIVG